MEGIKELVTIWRDLADGLDDGDSSDEARVIRVATLRKCADELDIIAKLTEVLSFAEALERESIERSVPKK